MTIAMPATPTRAHLDADIESCRRMAAAVPGCPVEAWHEAAIQGLADPDYYAWAKARLLAAGTLR